MTRGPSNKSSERISHEADIIAASEELKLILFQQREKDQLVRTLESHLSQAKHDLDACEIAAQDARIRLFNLSCEGPMEATITSPEFRNGH